MCLQGIFPDLLHIVDLQIGPDSICSALLDWSDASRRRDDALTCLRNSYTSWCVQEGFMACMSASVRSKILLYTRKQLYIRIYFYIET